MLFRASPCHSLFLPLHRLSETYPGPRHYFWASHNLSNWKSYMNVSLKLPHILKVSSIFPFVERKLVKLQLDQTENNCWSFIIAYSAWLFSVLLHKFKVWLSVSWLYKWVRIILNTWWKIPSAVLILNNTEHSTTPAANELHYITFKMW